MKHCFFGKQRLSWEPYLDWLFPFLIFLLLHDGAALLCRFLIETAAPASSFWEENRILIESGSGNAAAIPYLLYWLQKHPQQPALQEKRWGIEAAAIGVSLCICLNGCLMVSGLTKLFSEDYQQTSDALYGGCAAVTVLTSALIAPVAEELLYRGIVFRQIRSRKTFWAAALGSSLIFGACHMAVVQGIYGFFTGLALCLVYERKNKLKSCIAVHIFMNAASICITLGLNRLHIRPNDRMIAAFAVFAAGCLFFLLQNHRGKRPVRRNVVDGKRDEGENIL